MKRCVLVTVLCIFWVSNVRTARVVQPPMPPQIASITSSGPNTAQYSNGGHGVNASVGAWNGTYTVPEPKGTTQLRIVIDVNDGGRLAFSYWLQSFDTNEFDWANIYLDTPGGRVNIASRVNRRTKWEPPCCRYYSTPAVPVSRDLNTWAHQQVTLVVDLVNDGYGDQTQLSLSEVGFGFCQIPWPSDLTDPDAIHLETGGANAVDTENLTGNMKTALACLQTKIQNAGGRFDLSQNSLESAYRNPEYQAHLLEIFELHRELTNAGPECADVKQLVDDHYSRHALHRRPASRSGPHPRGIAVDINVDYTNLSLPSITQFADQCGLAAPLPDDTNHFVLRQQ